MPSRKKNIVKKKDRKTGEKPFNPFEVRVNRKKHNVLGQKRKSDVGMPGVSRSKSIQKRKKTLLLEYKRKNKSNQLIDRRFGEGEEGMSVEEKLTQRFILERKRKHERSGRFNLKDADDDDNMLTHFGQSIGDMEKFDSVGLSDEEMEEEDISEIHFGGFMKKKRLREGTDEENEAHPKSRKQILDEIVAKSKHLKYERQSEKEEVENLLLSVDSDWKEVRGLLSKPEEENVSRAVDDYDRSVRELQFERRGLALDRMKTEEELAMEEKERLEKLEADRLRRMKGLCSEGAKLEGGHISADFMKDSTSVAKKEDTRFTLRYKDGKMVLPPGQEEEGIEEEEEVEGEDEDVGESDGGDSGEDGDEDEGGSDNGEDGDSGEDEGDSEDGDSDEDEVESEGFGSDLNSEEDEQEEKKDTFVYRRETSSLNSDVIKKAASEELPYIYTVPRNLEEFFSLVDCRSPEDCLTIAERIHSCNHPSLSPSNKKQLEDFLPIMLDYCIHLGRGYVPGNMAILDKMVSPLFKLAKLNAEHTSSIFRKSLEAEYKQWMRRRTELPPFSALLLFQLVGVVFSVSDFKHPVTTPTMQFMGQILAKSRIKSKSDLLHGLLLCRIVIKYITDSKRLVPELVNFFISVLGCFSKSSDCIFLPPFRSRPHLRKELTADASTDVTVTQDILSETTLLQLLTNCSVSKEGCKEVSRCDLLSVLLDMILQIFQVYKDLPSFPELFSQLESNLARVAAITNWPLLLEEKLASTVSTFAELASSPRDVLMMFKQKPKSINFYEPKFDMIYEVDRKKARGRSIGETQKLKYKLKKETKGAIREVRKDTAFLAKVKLDETLVLDAERQRKTRLLMSELQDQQHQAKLEKRTTKKR